MLPIDDGSSCGSPLEGNSDPARHLVASVAKGGSTSHGLDDVLDLLAEVLEASVEGRPLGHQAGQWLAFGIRAAVRRAEPLEVSLGLAGPGKRSLQRQLLTLRRDMHLLRAIKVVAIEEGITDWQRCKRLAPLISQFMHCTWPKAKRYAIAPSDWPTWKVEVFGAACTDIELPRSSRGLYNLVQADARCSIHSRKATLLARLL